MNRSDSKKKNEKISFDLVEKDSIKNAKKTHVLFQTDLKSHYSIVSKPKNDPEFIVNKIKKNL